MKIIKNIEIVEREISCVSGGYCGCLNSRTTGRFLAESNEIKDPKECRDWCCNTVGTKMYSGTGLAHPMTC